MRERSSSNEKSPNGNADRPYCTEEICKRELARRKEREGEPGSSEMPKLGQCQVDGCNRSAKCSLYYLLSNGMMVRLQVCRDCGAYIARGDLEQLGASSGSRDSATKIG